MDITKPLRRFIIVAKGAGKGEIWGRLGYERLPTFCYKCGVIGHSEYECEQALVEGYRSNTKQYGDWLRASPLQKGTQRWNAGGMAKTEKQSQMANNIK